MYSGADLDKIDTPANGMTSIQIGIVNHTGFEGIATVTMDEDTALKIWKLFDCSAGEIAKLLADIKV